MNIMKFLKAIDANLEKTIILLNYVIMAAIIFVEVIRRFVFKEQAAWSTTIPIYLFLWVVWIGCAYNVKIRGHLRFDEVRTRLPYKAQFLCLLLDALLWIIFSSIVIFYTTEQVLISRDNYAIVQGTDNVLQWWFYIATPIAFALLIFRQLQNLSNDYRKFLKNEPFEIASGIMNDKNI